jgi:uncharacterized membrane protein
VWAAVVVTTIGALLVAAGVVAYATVSSTLAAERIVVADDAPCLGGQVVSGPMAAYCQAAAVSRHTLDATGGKTYAELDPTDPRRDIALNGSLVRASLLASVVAFGIALMAMGIGIALALIGVTLMSMAQRRNRAPDSA